MKRIALLLTMVISITGFSQSIPTEKKQNPDSIKFYSPELSEDLKSVSKQIDSLKKYILQNLKESQSQVGMIKFRNNDMYFDIYGPNSNVNTYTDTIPSNDTACKCKPNYEKYTFSKRAKFKSKIVETKNTKNGPISIEKEKTIKKRITYLKCTPAKNIALGKKLHVDSILFRLVDGALLELQVLGFVNDDKAEYKFSNANSAPIILSSQSFSKRNKLTSDLNKDEFINLNEVLIYTPIKSFFPDDETFVLSKYKKEHLFTKASGLNSLLDIRLYSDGFGVFGGKANGIAQIEINGNLAVGRKNLCKTSIRPFKYVGFNINGTKFDSRLAYTIADASFNRTSLLRKNWFSAEGYFSPLAGSMARTSNDQWFTNIGFGYDLSQLAFKTDTITSVSTFISGQLGFRFVWDNFGFEASTKYYYHFNQDAKELRYKESDRGFIKPQLNAYWNPMDNKNNKIFARVNWIADIHELKYQFFQLQFGYSILFGNLINK